MELKIANTLKFADNVSLGEFLKARDAKNPKTAYSHICRILSKKGISISIPGRGSGLPDT